LTVPVLRLLAIPYSTNVERVTLALGHKGVDVEIEMVATTDRSRVRAVSGQDLVPVLLDGDSVISDSSAILAYLDRRNPQPPLFPRDRRLRAEVDVFVQWFNRVWKGPPNEIDAMGAGDHGSPRRDELSCRLADSLDLFEGLLSGRSYLFGDGFGVADCIAFPFLKYAILGPAPDDDDTFHRVLAHHLEPSTNHSALRAWIGRVDARPRAGHPV
jgi:glutathione S-transferase